MERLYLERRQRAEKQLDVSPWIDQKTGALKPDMCNLTRIVMGKQEPLRGPLIHKGDYSILRRSQDNDDHWNSSDTKWLGKASMAAKGHHVLVLPGPNLMHDGRFCFNAVTMESNEITKKRLEDMRRIALDFAHSEWKQTENDTGLYFHVWPDHSQSHLHLHVVDLTLKGPSFEYQLSRNVPLESVIKVLF